MLLILFVAVLRCLWAQSPENATITNGMFFDSEGNSVQAHGAGILQWQGTYYLFGESQKHFIDGDWISQGVNCYSSQDLQHWTLQGMVFINTSIVSHVSGPYRIERPKVIHNAATNLFVLWFHLDTVPFSMQSVGVATSTSPTGPYQFVEGGCFQPDGQPSYDMTLFQDYDGTAYLVRSVGNKFAGFSQLTWDYMNTTGIVSSGPQIEGMAVWRVGFRYYLWGSHLTGWSPNPAILSYADNNIINATWNQLGNPSNNPTTYNSQSAYVLPYVHPNGDMLAIYIGDDWNYNGPGSVGNSSYVWLPLIPNDTGYSMPYEQQWSIADFV